MFAISLVSGKRRTEFLQLRIRLPLRRTNYFHLPSLLTTGLNVKKNINKFIFDIDKSN